jgi:hypothetical protein
MGGEKQRGSLNGKSGYSVKAHCIGKQSYLEPISGSLHVPIEGVYRATEKTEDRVTIGEKRNQNHVENTARTYLERIRNRMQKPIEGLPTQPFTALNKGEQAQSPNPTLANPTRFVAKYLKPNPTMTS